MDEILSCGGSIHPRPKKTKKERDPYDGLRPWAAITHGAGVLLGLVATALLLSRAAQEGDWRKTGIFALYSLSMLVLYLASTLYHSVNTTVKGRIALRKIDHTAICLLIAGSYTPVCLIALAGPIGYALFGAIWGLTLVGTVVALFWLSAPRWVTAGIYLFMGWMAVVALAPLSQVLSAEGFFWLLGGGLLYTVGGVLYAVKWPGRNNPRFGCHEIFHLFILMGSVFHFFMMYRVVVYL